MKNSLIVILIAFGPLFAFGQITHPVVNPQTEVQNTTDSIKICVEINGQNVEVSLPYGVATTIHFGPHQNPNSMSPESGNCSFDLQVTYGCGSVGVAVIGCVGCTSVVWNTGATSWNINVTQPGTYTATVSDANAGCTSVASVNIGSIPTGNLNISSSVTNAGCNVANGAINLSVSGGTSPYMYMWSNGATWEDISNLATGNYIVTVSDSHGCTGVFNAFVSGGQAPQVFNVTGGGSFCLSQGGVAVGLSGSQSGVQYQLKLNNNTVSTVQGTGGTISFGNQSNAGTYTVVATAQGSCTAQMNGSATITVVSSPTVNNPGTQNVCEGQQLNLAFSGSQGASFSWNSNQNCVGVPTSGSGNLSFTANNSGSITVSVVPTSGQCVGQSQTFTVNVNPIPQSPVIIPNINTNTQMASLSVNGPQGNYAWSGPGNFTGSGQSVNLSWPPLSGNYNVTLTVNGCSATDVAAVSQFCAVVPCNLNVTTIATAASCFGCSNGSATVNTTGANGNVTYLWSNGQTSQTISNLSAGAYCVTVKDGNNCMASACAIVTQPSLPNCNMTVQTTSVAASCFGCSNGSVWTVVFNGTLPLSYKWSLNGVVNTSWNTSDIQNLVAGNYCLTVTDGNNCTATSCTVVTQPNTPNCNLVVTTFPTAASCFGCSNGSVTTSTSGANGSVNYLWNTGATGSTLMNVSSGTYTVTATDANNCTTTATAFVSQPGNNPAPVADFTLTHVDCGITYLFDASSSLNNPTSWYWEFQGGIPATSTEEYPIVVFSTKGDKVIKLTVSNGNGSDTKVQIVNVKGITMNQGVLSGGTVLQNSYVTLQAPPGAHYHWGGIGIDAIEVPTLTSTLGTQNFSVTVTQSNGSTEVYCFVFTVVPNLVGTGDPDGLSAKIKTFPNPTSDFVTLEGLELLTQITVFNEFGQILNQQQYDGEIDLSSYPSGIYFIAGEGMRTQRVVRK